MHASTAATPGLAPMPGLEGVPLVGAPPLVAPMTTGDPELQPDICWQALRSRDRRFDGRFYVAAVTTGIYCRPICPVPFAKPNNIALYACAAAAEAEGFRPCRRCHPETSPGTPAWMGTSAVVSRALRLIWEGALDTGGVDKLAERVGIGSRQLRRLFIEHLGVPPIKIATTHRLHFARNLIEQTDMPMAQIALNAGFKSIRQFNHAMRTTTGQSPTELRCLRAELPILSQRGEFVMRLHYRPPYDWSALSAFLRSRATPGVELVGDDFYQRTIEGDGVAGFIDVRPDEENTCLVVRIALPKYEGLLRVVERVRRVFDLGADPLQIASHLSRDPGLKPLLDRRPGLRVPGAWDPFEVAVRVVLGQRLTVVDSNGVARDLVRRFGRPLQISVNGLTHLFPRAEDLADADLASVVHDRECAKSLTALARAVSRKEFTFEFSLTLQDAVSRLSAICGIGEEAAHYVVMRVFGDPDAFPLGGRTSVRAGLQSRSDSEAEACLALMGRRKPALQDPSSPVVGGAASIVESWRPWRAYAAMHLWLQSLQ
jgi:AraC family transcriptional regulator, regulatory protein of adaptative response / DNA-3-methyladenine glycosylase II